VGSLAIQVEGLGKRYRVAGASPPRTLRESLGSTIVRPWRAFGRRPARRGGGDTDSFWALRDVSFELREGDVLGVLGRNGAGKSTLLKILSRITEPTAGRARVLGRVGALLEVGTGFHPELTGRENVFLNGAILGMRRVEIERKFEEIVEFASVSAFLDVPVKRYSSGMYMRLAFAVAAHLEPEVLVVDEVLAVGDAAFQKKCLGKMGEVSRHGRTVLFVSHNIGAVVTLCNRAILLEQGALLEDGPAADVATAYQARIHQAPSVEQGEVDLRDAERFGSGKARFVRLGVRPLPARRGAGDDGEARLFLRPGDDVELVLTIEAQSAIADANVAIVIYDPLGYRLVDANTILQGGTLALEPGQRAEVCFVLEDLRLRPGSYLVGLWLGRANDEDVDGITYASAILVEPDPHELKHAQLFPGVYQPRFRHTIRIEEGAGGG
jgi:lipopolysaccharide transport system ATP-binding protein